MTSVTSSSDREIFAAYVCDDVSAQLMGPVVADRGWSKDLIFQGGIAAGVRALGAMPVPEFLIVDISESTDPRADIQTLADVCDEGTVVLAIGSINDVTLYRDLINAGVHDYLVKPLAADVLRGSIDGAVEAMMATDEVEETVAPTTHQNIVIIGVRGGAGTSTLATNTAWLKAEKGVQTVLLDLDVYFGTTAMQFDLEPGRGLIDALDNPSRVDGLFLERAVVKPHDKLAILCAEAALGSVPPPAEGALPHLLEAMSNNYPCVIVDVPRQMLGEHSELLEAATDIVLVTDYSLASARDLIRIKAHIASVAPNAKVHLVADRVGIVPAEVDEKDFENSVEHEVSAKIPYDTKSALAAAQKGKVVVDALPSSKLANAFKDVCALFDSAEKADTGAKKSWFGKFLKK